MIQMATSIAPTPYYKGEAMTKNVGHIDRFARIGIGLAMLAVGIAYPSWWGAIGLVPLLTGFVRWCPAYSIFKFDTCNPFGKGDTCGADLTS